MTQIEITRKKIHLFKTLLSEVESHEQPKIRWWLNINQFYLVFFLFESWLEQLIRLRSKIATSLLFWLPDMIIEGRFPRKIGKYRVVDTFLVWFEEVSK